MPRVNLCTNPHADVDTTGWTSNDSISRVSGTGFPKANVVESSVGVGLIWTARGAVTPGTEYTISALIKNISAAGNANPFIEWRDSDDASLSYSSGTSTDCPTNVVTAVSATGTAPANAVYAALLIGNMSGVRQVAAALIEPAATPSAYADGDTSGWAWDGTAGLSSSTQSAGSVSGTAAAALGALTATATGVTTVTATAAASLGALTATAAGIPTVHGVAAASLGALTATAAGARTVRGTAAASLGRLTAHAAGTPTTPATTRSSGGNWGDLKAIIDETRLLPRVPVVACPNDGEPLIGGPGGVFFCKFDGWRA